MRKLLLLTGSVLLIAALGAGVWWAWPILFPASPAGWLSILSKADAALLQNRPDQARALLDEVPETLPVTGWIQWEKRVQAVAVRTGAWVWAAQTAARAQRQYPGNPDLTAYLVWTLLRAGQPEEAAEWAGKVLPGTRWEGLAVQAAVEAQGLAHGNWSDLAETLSRPTAEALGAYERLTALDPEPSLRKNALLTALARGRLEEARRHLGVLTPEQRDRPPFDRLQGLMAYDQGDWARAAALLKSLTKTQPETWMVLADVYLHLGDPEQARLIYDQLLADYPEDLPASLVVNRATLALDQGDPGTALDLLGRGSPKTGEAADRTRLLVLEARFRLGETEAVRKALDGLLSAGGETPLSLEAELLKGRLFPEWTSIPRLWSLLHRHPGFAPLAERLAWLLLVNQEYSGAHRVLQMNGEATAARGETVPWWSTMLRAYLYAVEDRLEEASAALATVPAAWRDSTFYANWGLVSQILAQKVPPENRKLFLDDALERHTKALDLLSPNAEAAFLSRRSLWLTRRGELELSLVPLQLPAQRGALRSAAIEDLRQAVQLDPENLRASFLLRQATTQEKP